MWGASRRWWGTGRALALLAVLAGLPGAPWPARADEPASVDPVVEPVDPVVEPVDPVVEPVDPVVEPVDPVARLPPLVHGWGPPPDDLRRVLPDEAHGVAERLVLPRRHLLHIPRALLFIPRTTLRMLTEPIRFLALLEDRYRLYARMTDSFYVDQGRTFGVFPTLFFETGFGLNGGLRVFHRDLFGQKENLWIRAGFGGIHRQVYYASFDTGERFGPDLWLESEVGFRSESRNRFFGIGNPDELDTLPPDTLLDARQPEASVASRFRNRTAWAFIAVAGSPAPNLVLRLAQQIRYRSFSVGGQPRDVPWLTDAYDVQTVVGFDSFADSRTEVRLSYHDTETHRIDAPDALPSSGVHFDVWAGYQEGLGSPYRFAPMGFDLQGFIDLFGGNRVLRLRLRAATAVGSEGRVPFDDLPALGGVHLLRGYSRERFRDRLAVLSTVEYRFPVLSRIAGYLFIDTGRVYESIRRLTVEGLRMGYGGGFVLFTPGAFLMRFQLASSIDGGLFVQFNLNTTHALGAIN